MSSAIEWFHAGRGKAASTKISGPRALVSKNGAITLNEEAINLFGEHLNANVLLGFDPESKLILIRAADEGTSGSLKLSEVRNTRSRKINAASFLRLRDLFEQKFEREVKTFDKQTLMFAVEGDVEPTRTRRPRRTKAQIEADKAEAEAKRIDGEIEPKRRGRRSRVVVETQQAPIEETNEMPNYEDIPQDAEALVHA